MMFNTLIDSQWGAYARLARLDRPAGIHLLLWPTLTALWCAKGGLPDFKLILIFTLGAFIMRAAGGVINDLTDRKLDQHVQRTQNRPLASGELGVPQALLFFGVLIFLAFILVSQLNTLCLYIAIVGLGLTCLYPWMKRITNMPQVVLSVVWSLSIPMAYAAVQGKLDTTAYWLFLGNLLLTLAYDTIYAISDREDDLKIGVKSLAILLGSKDKPIIALFHAGTWFCWFQVGLDQEFGVLYSLMLMGSLGFMGYQHHLIQDDDQERCLKAFTNHQWLVGLMFGVTCLSLI